MVKRLLLQSITDLNIPLHAFPGNEAEASRTVAFVPSRIVHTLVSAVSGGGRRGWGEEGEETGTGKQQQQ